MLQVILKLQSTHCYWVDFDYYGSSKSFSVRLYEGKRDSRKKPILREQFYMDQVVSPSWSGEYKRKYEDFLKLLEEKYQNVAPPKI